MQRFTEVVHVALGGGDVGQVRHAVEAAAGRRQDDPPATSRDQPPPEVVGQFEVGGRVEGDLLPEVIDVVVEEVLGDGPTGVRHQTPPPDLAARLVAASPELLRPEGPPRFEDIAALVGVSRGTLYYYLAGQDELLSFLLIAHVEEGAATMAAADPGAGTARARLRSVLSAAVDYLGGRPGVCAGLLRAAASGGGMRDVLWLNDELIALPVRDLISAGVTAGDLMAVDVTGAADAILGGALLGVLARSARGDDPADVDFHRRLVDQLVGGLENAPPTGAAGAVSVRPEPGT